MRTVRHTCYPGTEDGEGCWRVETRQTFDKVFVNETGGVDNHHQSTLASATKYERNLVVDVKVAERVEDYCLLGSVLVFVDDHGVDVWFARVVGEARYVSFVRCVCHSMKKRGVRSIQGRHNKQVVVECPFSAAIPNTTARDSQARPLAWL